MSTAFQSGRGGGGALSSSGGSGESTSSDYDDAWSSCSSCSSETEAFAANRVERHKSVVAARALYARRAQQTKLQKKVLAVKNAIAAVLHEGSASPNLPTSSLGGAESTDTFRAPTGTSASPGALPSGKVTALSDGSLPNDPASRVSAPTHGDASPAPSMPLGGNATPILGAAEGLSRRPSVRRDSMVRRGSVVMASRRSSMRSTAGALDHDVSSEEPDEDFDATHGSVGSEPWKPTKEQELQMNVASIMKRKLRTKADIDMELTAKALANKRPVVPIAPVPSAQAILKPYNSGGMGKSVTAFGAAAMAVFFLVRMKRLSTGVTQHKRNQERLELIQTVREKKNEVLSHQIAGATVRSMHLHITKQRSGLGSLVSAAVKESNSRTRNARIGKAASARDRKPLLSHQEDRLFDRSEFRRANGSRGSTAGGSGLESAAFSGTFGGANQFTELSQFLFERQASAGPDPSGLDASRLQSPAAPSAAGGDASMVALSPSGSARGPRGQQQGPEAGSAVLPSGHRPLDMPLVNKNLFVMHHRWRDEAFKDTYVETERVYQYATQQGRSDLYAFTRTALPNLHLEVHRLKSQLDPEPWDGTRADHFHRLAMDQRNTDRKKRAAEAATRKAERIRRMNDTAGSMRTTAAPSPATARLPSNEGGMRSSAPQPPSTARPDTVFASRPGSQCSATSLPAIGSRRSHSKASTPRAGGTASRLSTPREGMSQSTDLPALFPSTAGSPRDAAFVTENTQQSAAEGVRARVPQPPADPRIGKGIPINEEMLQAARQQAEAKAEERRRCAALDEDARAQRRQELALLEQVMEEEHRVAIDTFHRFLLHKEMEHSTFTSRSIDEVRRLIESNSLIFPMKRKEILKGPDGRLERRAVGRAMQRDLVSPRLAASRKGAASHDAFRDLREAELHVKELVREHQHARSVQYTQRWFLTLRMSIEAHMGGLTPNVEQVFAQFEPLFNARISGPKPFHQALRAIEDQVLLGGDVQFVLHRLAVPFRVKHSEIRDYLASKGIALLLLSSSFYRTLRDQTELNDQERERTRRMGAIDSMVAVNDKLEGAIAAGEAKAEAALREQQAAEERAALALAKGPSFVDVPADTPQTREGRRGSTMSRRLSNASQRGSPRTVLSRTSSGVPEVVSAASIELGAPSVL